MSRDVGDRGLETFTCPTCVRGQVGGDDFPREGQEVRGFLLSERFHHQRL